MTCIYLPGWACFKCSSKRTTRIAEPHEMILDQADGLDWPTLCKCDLIHAVGRWQEDELVALDDPDLAPLRGHIGET